MSAVLAMLKKQGSSNVFVSDRVGMSAFGNCNCGGGGSTSNCSHCNCTHCGR